MSSVKIYKIVRSRRKTVALHVTKDAELVVRAPNYVSKIFITRFVRENVTWIERRKKEILKKRALKKKFIEGEEFWFLGEKYTLSILPKNACGKRRKNLSFDPQKGFELAEGDRKSVV